MVYTALLQSDFIVETSLIGVVLNGLSHFHHVESRAHFAVCLIRGLGGNLPEASREDFAKEVFTLRLCCFGLLGSLLDT